MPKPNPDDYTAQANDFARIGDKEKTLWQLYYYAAFSILKRKNTDATKPNCTTRRSGKEAQITLTKQKLSPNNAEIYILKK